MTAATRAVEWQTGGQVAHLWLNRPRQSNAFDLPAARQLHDAVGALAGDTESKVVVLSAVGSRFCAGGDVTAMTQAADRAKYVFELARALDDALLALASLRQPVVAAVQGVVAGAGLALMLSCDVIVSGRGTRFVPAYVDAGLTPDCGVTYLLPRAVGQPRALQFLLSGARLDAPTALSWGLVNELVDDDQLAERAVAVADRLAGLPPYALEHAKRLVRQSWQFGRTDVGLEEARVISAASVTDDARERVDQFVARRGSSAGGSGR